MTHGNPNWAKGKSANPGGRPKLEGQFRELVRKKSLRNIEVMEQLRDHAEDENVRLRAAIALHEIAWGKPAQAVTGEDGGPVALTISWLPVQQTS